MDGFNRDTISHEQIHYLSTETWVIISTEGRLKRHEQHKRQINTFSRMRLCGKYVVTKSEYC